MVRLDRKGCEKLCNAYQWEELPSVVDELPVLARGWVPSRYERRSHFQQADFLMLRSVHIFVCTESWV